MVLPFVFMGNVAAATRVSDGLAVATLYFYGHLLGAYAGGRPWRYGISIAAIGVALVAIIMALGGMSTRTWPALASAMLALCAAETAAQPMAAARVSAQPASSAADGGTEHWSFAASAYTYFLPEADDYVQPTLTADRGRLHLEARYNYESMKTGSAWVGVTFGGGSR